MTHPAAAASLRPVDLPAVGDPERWSVLRRLHRQPSLPTLPWLAALEAGDLPLEADLVNVLAEHLDGEGASRLLRLWLRQERRDPQIPPLLGHRHDPLWAASLRAGIREAGDAERSVLIPLLGHQRDRSDFAQLRAWLLDPGPLAVRRAALDALKLGLSAWPLPPLRSALATAARDLQPVLAGEAVDALARLPAARADLLRLARHHLDPRVSDRLQRRLRSLPAAPLLLLVHGRSGGSIPEELLTLADALERRRGAPVRLLALTDPTPPLLPQASTLAPPTTLVPLLLLPGSHVRHDLPAHAAALRQQGPMRRLPFLGSWPAWQRALAQEVETLVAGSASVPRPQLLHHPLQGLQAERYLAMLARRCGADCRPAAFDPSGAGAPGDVSRSSGPAFLPLALAANRLTDSLRKAGLGAAARPLLARPRLWHTLVEALLALP